MEPASPSPAKSPIMSTATATGATSKLSQVPQAKLQLEPAPSVIADKAKAAATATTATEWATATVAWVEVCAFFSLLFFFCRLNRLTGCDCNLTVNCVWQTLTKLTYPPPCLPALFKHTLAAPALISLMCACVRVWNASRSARTSRSHCSPSHCICHMCMYIRMCVCLCVWEGKCLSLMQLPQCAAKTHATLDQRATRKTVHEIKGNTKAISSRNESSSSRRCNQRYKR